MYGNGLELTHQNRTGLLGAPDQMIGIERYAITNNTGAAAQVLFLRNPAGLSGEVFLDRALDLGSMFTDSISLAWKRPAEIRQSLAFDPRENGWSRSFAGGLLATCGLESTGKPSVDEGRQFGLHGRVGQLPAREVRWEYLTNDRLDHVMARLHQTDPVAPSIRGRLGEVFHVEGHIIETALGAPTLVLERHLFFSVGHPALLILDLVHNVGTCHADHMFRHHFNIGYPLVQPGSSVSVGGTPIGSRDGEESPDLPWKLDIESGSQSKERVLYFSTGAPPQQVTLVSPTSHKLSIEYSTGTFPYLIVWRDATAGVNVLGIEPSTSLDGGRAEARQQGHLVELLPGDVRSYWSWLELSAS